MIADIKRLLAADPFRPFSLVTSSGLKYHVPTRDHAGFSPSGTRILVWFDDDSSVDVAALHVVALEKDAPASAPVA